MPFKKQQQTASQWVHEYSDALYGYVVQRVKDSHIAKDLVQETFLAAWRNVDQYNGEAAVKTWLFTILKNKIIDHYRKTAAGIITTLDEGNGHDPFFDSEDHWAKGVYPADWGINYEAPVETKEFYVILASCRSKLKEIQNTVFSMKYLDGLESEEICKVLRLSSSNYWVLVHRAKIQLRACLEKTGFYVNTLTMGITCKKATEYILKKEEGNISFRQRLQLWRHLAICSLCRLFSQQNLLLISALKKAGTVSRLTLSTEEKESIVDAMNNDAGNNA